MKKLRCESCGGELRVEENNEYASCDYCRTRYKLNEDKTIVIKIDDSIKDACNNVGKKVIPLAFVGVTLVIIFIVGFGVLMSSQIFGDNDNDKFDISSFNNQFEMTKGTEPTYFVGILLDEVSESNKKNKRKVTVVYNEISTDDSEKIVNLKHKLNASAYEVKHEYDSKGYINKIIIEDIK